jgi:hypothetical protein
MHRKEDEETERRMIKDEQLLVCTEMGRAGAEKKMI